MSDLNIYVILDGSGSMSGVKNDVVTGVNDFVDEQKNEAASNGLDVRFSLTTFDTKVMQVYDLEDISLVNPVTTRETYLGGGTALLDAIGKTLTNAEDTAAPRNIVVIYTDGHENASREFTHEEIKDLLDNLENTGRWQIMYLGAEFADFQKEAAMIGIAAASTINTSKGAVNQTWANVSRSTSYYSELDEKDALAVASTGGLITNSAKAGVDWKSAQEKTNDEKTM